MKSDRYQKIRRLFHAVCDLDAAEREKLIAETCVDDAELRAEIDVLLAGDQDQQDVFAEGQIGVGRQLILQRPKHDPVLAEAAASGHGRYLPGAKVAGRYRIVSLLGTGGMGQVYRADDMKLGHAVALKFLSGDYCNDVQRLQFFLNEVRLSRKITHANVCRVYDVGEADNIHFLSMEYIDGEDLSRLLKRIGRIPHAKGIDIARQLCRGLAAAHRQGVLHRDLKPANVMIDGRGQVRITDFGLARLASDPKSSRQVVGTPAYMAPEQLARGETTIQSDIYSLGLVLYELFTGEAAHKASPAGERPSTSLHTYPQPPSSIADDIPPAIDRIINACLQPDSGERPPSADVIALALPGGDSLDAALAAGETPSPELVSAAGTKQGLKWTTRVAILAGILVGMLCIAILSNKSQSRIGFDAESLIRTRVARRLLQTVGYDQPAADCTWGLAWNQDYFDYFQNNEDAKREWARLTGKPPAAALFWYRQHRDVLVPERGRGPYWSMFVLRDDPPLIEPGMASLTLDGDGRLLEFRAIPTKQQVTESQVQSINSTQWQSQLLAAAGIDSNRIDAEQVILTPSDFWLPRGIHADQWEAWKSNSGSIVIEAAGYRGRAVYFRLAPAIETQKRGAPRALGIIFVAAVIAILISAVILARRNWLAGNADRLGATKMFGFILVMSLFYWLFQSHHVPGSEEFLLIAETSARAILRGVLICAAYLAIEPYVRRLWPHTLIGWNRLLRGRFGDALVGRHVLAGIVGGVFAQLLGSAGLMFGNARQIVLLPEPIVGIGSGPFSLRPLMGPQVALGQLCAEMMVALVCGFVVIALFFFVLRSVFRKTWLAIIVYVLFFSTSSFIKGDIQGAVTIALWCMLGLFLFLQFGVLTVVVSWFTWQTLAWPVTFDPTSPHIDIGLIAFLLVATLAVYAFFITAGNKNTISDLLFKT